MLPVAGGVRMPQGITAADITVQYLGVLRTGGMVAGGTVKAVAGADGIPKVAGQVLQLATATGGDAVERYPYADVKVSYRGAAVGYEFRVDLSVPTGAASIPLTAIPGGGLTLLEPEKVPVLGELLQELREANTENSATLSLIQNVLADTDQLQAAQASAIGAEIWKGGDSATLPSIPGDYLIFGDNVSNGERWRVAVGGAKTLLPDPLQRSITDRLISQTVAALGLSPGKVRGDARFLKGRTYWWDDLSVLASDGVAILEAVGGGMGRWVLAEREWGYNIKWFGAVGDDVHDDTAAIQACAATRQPMIIPEPLVAWKLTAQVRLWNSITGLGNHPLMRRYGSNGELNLGNMFIYRNYQGSMAVARNLTLDMLLPVGDNYPIAPQAVPLGNQNEQGHTFNIEGSSNVKISDILFLSSYGDNVRIGEHYGSPEALEMPYYCVNVEVSDCDMRRPRRCNVAVTSAKGARILRNRMQKDGGYVAVIDVEPNLRADPMMEGVLIEGNTVDAPDAKFVNLYTPNVQKIKGVTICNNPGITARYGVSQTTGQTEDLVIDNNDYLGGAFPAYFLLLKDALRPVITNNRDYSVLADGSGWSLTRVIGGIIRKNTTFNKTRASSLTLDGCTDTDVIDNDFAANTTSPAGAISVRSQAGASAGLNFLRNRLRNARYGLRVQDAPITGSFIGNDIEATERGLTLDGAAAGSDITMDKSNKMSGGGMLLSGVLARPGVIAGAKSSQDVTYGSTLPASGYYERRHQQLKPAPNIGDSEGWINTSPGWASNVAWAAATAYVVGAEVNVGGRVYRASAAGTSSATAPIHTSGTAVDGGVSWLYLGPLALWGALGKVGSLTAPPAAVTPPPPTIIKANAADPGTLALKTVSGGAPAAAVTTDADPVRPHYRLQYTWTPDPVTAPATVPTGLIRLRVNGPVGYAMTSFSVTATETKTANPNINGFPRPISWVENTPTNTYIYFANAAATAEPLEIVVAVGYGPA